MPHESDSELREGVERVADAVGGGELERAVIVGTGLAIVDALRAIRDGQQWRGRSDPRDIAGALLREIG